MGCNGFDRVVVAAGGIAKVGAHRKTRHEYVIVIEALVLFHEGDDRVDKCLIVVFRHRQEADGREALRCGCANVPWVIENRGPSSAWKGHHELLLVREVGVLGHIVHDVGIHEIAVGNDHQGGGHVRIECVRCVIVEPTFDASDRHRLPALAAYGTWLAGTVCHGIAVAIARS